MTVKYVGSGTFADTDEVELKGTSRPSVHIFAYAKFRSLEHVSYGLYRTEGKFDAPEIDSEPVGAYGMEPLAPFSDLGDVLDDVAKHKTWVFEEVPYVEVTSKSGYDKAVATMGLDPKEGAWEGPGLYDFRDEPPEFRAKVEDYELESMTDAADQAIEFMFQGDEWKDAYRNLASE